MRSGIGDALITANASRSTDSNERTFLDMKRLLTLFSVATVFTGLALAADWSGKLLDAACYAQEKGAKPCDATATTSTFLIDVAGKVYRLDDAGNTKAATALKSGADRSKDPGQPAGGGPVMAKVTGTAEGETIKVDTIEVR